MPISLGKTEQSELASPAAVSPPGLCSSPPCTGHTKRSPRRAGGRALLPRHRHSARTGHARARRDLRRAKPPLLGFTPAFAAPAGAGHCPCCSRAALFHRKPRAVPSTEELSTEELRSEPSGRHQRTVSSPCPQPGDLRPLPRFYRSLRKNRTALF